MAKTSAQRMARCRRRALPPAPDADAQKWLAILVSSRFVDALLRRGLLCETELTQHPTEETLQKLGRFWELGVAAAIAAAAQCDASHHASAVCGLDDLDDME